MRAKALIVGAVLIFLSLSWCASAQDWTTYGGDELNRFFSQYNWQDSISEFELKNVVTQYDYKSAQKVLVKDLNLDNIIDVVIGNAILRGDNLQYVASIPLTNPIVSICKRNSPNYMLCAGLSGQSSFRIYSFDGSGISLNSSFNLNSTLGPTLGSFTCKDYYCGLYATYFDPMPQYGTMTTSVIDIRQIPPLRLASHTRTCFWMQGGWARECYPFTYFPLLLKDVTADGIPDLTALYYGSSGVSITSAGQIIYAGINAVNYRSGLSLATRKVYPYDVFFFPNQGFYIYTLDGRWGTAYSNQTFVSPAFVVDLDLDGYDEGCALMQYNSTQNRLVCIKAKDGSTYLEKAISDASVYTTGTTMYGFRSKGDVYFTTPQGLYRISGTNLVKIMNLTSTGGNSGYVPVDLDGDGDLDLISSGSTMTRAYYFDYEEEIPPNYVKFIVRDASTNQPIYGYKLYDINTQEFEYTNSNGEIIKYLPNGVYKYFGQKGNSYYYVGLRLNFTETTYSYEMFPMNTASVTLTKVDNYEYEVLIKVFTAGTLLSTKVLNVTTPIVNTRIYNPDYDIMFRTNSFGEVVWALMDGTYSFLLMDYGLSKSARKQGNTNVVWNLGAGGGMAGKQVCLPNSEQLCLNPIIQNNEFYCDIDDLYSCSVTCYDYRCDHCFNRNFCVFIDYFDDYTASPTYYGWYVLNGSMPYSYQQAFPQGYIRSVLMLYDVTETPKALYQETPPDVFACKYPTCTKHYVLFSMLVNPSEYGKGIVYTMKDPDGKVIMSMRERMYLKNLDAYNVLELYNGSGWSVFINGSSQVYPSTSKLYRITIDLSSQKYTLEVDADEDMSFDYSTTRSLVTATTKETQYYIFEPEDTKGVTFLDDFQVFMFADSDICTAFYDKFEYSTSIQTGKDWYGDLIYPSTQFCTQNSKEYFEGMGANAYGSTYHICFDASKHSSIGFNTQCYSTGNIFDMDFVYMPDNSFNNNFEVRFVGAGGQNLKVQFLTSTASAVIPNKRSKLRFWNGQAWINVSGEFTDYRIHRLSVAINFNTNTASIILDDRYPLLLYEPIYLSQAYIDSIELRRGGIANDKSVMAIYGVYWNSEGVTPKFNTLLGSFGYASPEEGLYGGIGETGLLSHYSCGWNLSAGAGNYFNWNLCTPAERQSKSTWCIIRTLGRCSIGNLTIWMLNNFLFTIVIIILIALFIPFIVRRAK